MRVTRSIKCIGVLFMFSFVEQAVAGGDIDSPKLINEVAYYASVPKFTPDVCNNDRTLVARRIITLACVSEKYKMSWPLIDHYLSKADDWVLMQEIAGGAFRIRLIYQKANQSEWRLVDISYSDKKAPVDVSVKDGKPVEQLLTHYHTSISEMSYVPPDARTVYITLASKSKIIRLAVNNPGEEIKNPSEQYLAISRAYEIIKGIESKLPD